MKTLSGLFLALVIAGGLNAQYRGFMTSSPGNVVFPGIPSGYSGVVRSPASVVYPGGGGPRKVIPSSTYGIGTTPYVYAYPVYVPAYDNSMYASPDQGAPPAGSVTQPAPNVIIVYPPQAPPAVSTESAHPSMQIYQPAVAQQPADEPSGDHYIFAFKDHSIYSVVAYWVDGNTLHYFTNANTHKQVSLDMLDRELTERLNSESGAELKLPPVKQQ